MGDGATDGLGTGLGVGLGVGMLGLGVGVTTARTVARIDTGVLAPCLLTAERETKTALPGANLGRVYDLAVLFNVTTKPELTRIT